jgi:hypothetical protein
MFNANNKIAIQNATGGPSYSPFSSGVNSGGSGGGGVPSGSISTTFTTLNYDGAAINLAQGQTITPQFTRYQENYNPALNQLTLQDGLWRVELQMVVEKVSGTSGLAPTFTIKAPPPGATRFTGIDAQNVVWSNNKSYFITTTQLIETWRDPNNPGPALTFEFEIRNESTVADPIGVNVTGLIVACTKIQSVY